MLKKSPENFEKKLYVCITLHWHAPAYWLQGAGSEGNEVIHSDLYNSNHLSSCGVWGFSGVNSHVFDLNIISNTTVYMYSVTSKALTFRVMLMFRQATGREINEKLTQNLQLAKFNISCLVNNLGDWLETSLKFKK